MVFVKNASNSLFDGLSNVYQYEDFDLAHPSDEIILSVRAFPFPLFFSSSKKGQFFVVVFFFFFLFCF